MIADCKIIILYLHIDKVKFDYVNSIFVVFGCLFLGVGE